MYYEAYPSLSGEAHSRERAARMRIARRPRIASRPRNTPPFGRVPPGLEKARSAALDFRPGRYDRQHLRSTERWRDRGIGLGRRQTTPMRYAGECIRSVMERTSSPVQSIQSDLPVISYGFPLRPRVDDPAHRHCRGPSRTVAGRALRSAGPRKSAGTRPQGVPPFRHGG